MKINALRREHGLAGFLWKTVWGPVNVILAFLPLLSLNLLQFPSLLLLPFSKKAFRRYNRGCAFVVWGWWAFGVRRLVGLEVTVAGDELPRGENAIVIGNHQGMADILLILCLALDKGSLSSATWMAKDVLKYVPGLGWGMAFLDTIFLRRNWMDDADTIKATFAKIVDNNVPIWLISFPEGTRSTVSKMQSSQAYAKSQGKLVTDHVLLPRPKGFAASVQGLRQHVTAVYSVTLGYEGSVPSLIEVMRGDVDRSHIHVRRFAISGLPEEEAALSEWLQAEFREKDKLLAHFYAAGEFPEPQGNHCASS